MHLTRKIEDAMWRTIEWSFVMGILAWLFVRLWTESLYESNRRSATEAGWFRRRKSRSPIQVTGHRAPVGVAPRPHAERRV
jgi:hypothetical protein